MSEQNLNLEVVRNTENKELEETAIKLAKELMAEFEARKAGETEITDEETKKFVEEFLNKHVSKEKDAEKFKALKDKVGALGVPVAGSAASLALMFDELEKKANANETPNTETLEGLNDKVNKKVPTAEKKDELQDEMREVNVVHHYTPGLIGLAAASANVTAKYLKENNIDVVNEAKEFIKNAPDTAVEAVNKGVDFVQEQATKGYESAKVGAKKGVEILQKGVKDGVNFVKDTLDYINPFTLNDTLNNAGQKVNPDAMEQTPMLKDNSKDMA